MEGSHAPELVVGAESAVSPQGPRRYRSARFCRRHRPVGERVAQAAQSRFVFANESDYDTADPHVAFDVGRVAVRLNIYDGLMRWQKNPAVLEPWVAESHTISADGLTYTFKMRKGVKFHDGSEVKASDVVYSLERILALGKGAASLFKSMIASGSAKAVDDYTVEFTADETVGDLPLDRSGDSHRQCGAGQEERGQRRLGRRLAVQEQRRFRRLQDQAVRSGHRLRRRAHSRITSRAGVRSSSTRSSSAASRTPTRASLGLDEGRFQGIGGYLQTDQLKKLEASGNAKVLEAESMRVMIMEFNTTRAPLNDLAVRQALNQAFDYDGFNKDILGGLVERNPTPLPNTMWGVPKDVKGYTYDVESRQSHARQGRGQGRPSPRDPLPHRLRPERAGRPAVPERPLQDRSAVEGDRHAVADDRRALQQARDDARHIRLLDLHLLRRPAQLDRRDVPLRERRHLQERKSLQEPEGGRTPRQGRAVDRPGHRAKLYEEAVRIVVADAPGLWIYNTKWYGPYSKNLQGIVFCPIGNAQEMRTAYYE